MKYFLYLVSIVMTAVLVSVIVFASTPLQRWFSPLHIVLQLPLEKSKLKTSTTTLTTADRLIFTGDVMLARHIERISIQQGPTYFFNSLDVPTTKAIVVGNFEGSIPKNHVPTPNFTFAFSVATSTLKVLNAFGFTHLSLANNHSNDFGTAGFDNTVRELSTAGFKSFGDYQFSTTSDISYVTINTKSVALVGIHATKQAPSLQELQLLFSTAAASSSLQIAYIHWGSEYSFVHNEFQERLATLLVAAGADLIVGHHPHVVQDIQLINTVPVFYSLGNFIFDQYFSEAVQQGLVLVVTSVDDMWEIKLQPVTSVGVENKLTLMEGSERESFFNDLINRSDLLLSSVLKTGVITF